MEIKKQISLRAEAGSEVDKEAAWWIRAKRKGLRWQMLREIVAATSKQPLTTRDCQTWMQTIRGLSYMKTRQMLGELRNSGMIAHNKERMEFYWTATDKGVREFLVQRQFIPARIVDALLMLTSARELESTP